MLDMKLDVLDGTSIQDLLRKIAAAAVGPKTDIPALPADRGSWDIAGELNRDQFVLEFPSTFSPTFGTPGISTHPGCCASWILRPICC